VTAGSAADTLGRRLSEWRREQQISITEASRTLAVHPSTYKRREDGRRPYPRHLESIATVLEEDLATMSALAGPAPQRRGRPAPSDASILTKARLAEQLNRVELGRRLQLGPATVYRWARGRTRPPEQLLVPLAEQLSLTREQLEEALSDHPPYRHDGEVLPGLGAALCRHGLRRAQVQKLVDAAPSTVFEWETGRTRVPTRALRQLSTALDMTVDQLTTAGGQSSPGVPVATTLATLRRRVLPAQSTITLACQCPQDQIGRVRAR
jgi:transcriptional regulator with XRE-family HTH domain